MTKELWMELGSPDGLKVMTDAIERAIVIVLVFVMIIVEISVDASEASVRLPYQMHLAIELESITDIAGLGLALLAK